MPLLLLLALTTACRDSQDGDLVEVEVGASEVVPTVFTLRWSGPPGQTYVEYGLGDRFELSTPKQESEDGAAATPILGLKAGRTYSARAVTLGEDGQRYESGVVELETPLPPADLPIITALTHDPDTPRGFLLTSIIQEDPGKIVILDSDGDLVWWFELDADYVSPSQRLSLDGTSVWAMVGDREQSRDLGGLWRIDLDGRQASRVRALRSHHDFLELQDGRMAWLTVVEQEVELGSRTANLIGDGVVIAELDGLETVEEQVFSAFEDYGEPYESCAHFDEGAYGLDGFDWTHGNSLAELSDGDLLINLRNLDTVLRYDPVSGEVVWRMGGARSDLSLSGGEPWQHAHFSQAWDGGLILMDNGNHREVQESRIAEYAWDEDAGSYTETWSYQHPEGRFTPSLGDATRLPDGDVIIAWSVEGHVQRVTPEKETRWELYTSLGAHFSRVRWIEDIYAPE